MTTQTDHDDDDDLPKYDLSNARPARHFDASAGAVVITLDPDVAAEFSDAAQVNAALREVIRTRAQ